MDILNSNLPKNVKADLITKRMALLLEIKEIIIKNKPLLDAKYKGLEDKIIEILRLEAKDLEKTE